MNAVLRPPAALSRGNDGQPTALGPTAGHAHLIVHEGLQAADDLMLTLYSGGIRRKGNTV